MNDCRISLSMAIGVTFCGGVGGVVGGVSGSAMSHSGPDMVHDRMANRLAGETSPYLLQHRDNPVDWYPWGDEAFARARAEGKPVFVSIGYAACHWCHVMAHESFENPQIAQLMNQLFINVK